MAKTPSRLKIVLNSTFSEYLEQLSLNQTKDKNNVNVKRSTYCVVFEDLY